MDLHAPAPRTLDEKGRCCGRKPLVYKREGHRFCDRCSRHYHLTEPHMVDGWDRLADGSHRFRYPQGGGQQAWRQQGGWWWFFHHGLVPPIQVTASCCSVVSDGMAWREVNVGVHIFMAGNSAAPEMGGHVFGFQCSGVKYRRRRLARHA